MVDKYSIQGIGMYVWYGKVTQEFGHYSLEAMWVRKISPKPDPRISNDPTFENVSDFRSKDAYGSSPSPFAWKQRSAQRSRLSELLRHPCSGWCARHA